MRRSEARVFFQLFCFLSITLSSPARGEYEVEGTISQTILNFNGGAPYKLRNDFTVFVRDCAWLIQIRPAGSTNHTAGIQEVGSTNGTDIFFLNIAPPSNNPTNHPLSSAQVFSYDTPVDNLDSGVIGHLWLMFASGCVLQTNTTSALAPVYDIAAAPLGPNGDFKREAKWDLINGPGSTPSSVYFITSPLDKSTNAVYRATGQTNVGNVTVASGFTFAQLLPERWLNGIKLPAGPRKEVICTVTALRQGCTRSDLLPAPQGRTIVGDLRIKMPKEGTNAPPTVTYFYPTNQGWLSTNDAKVLFVAEREKFLEHAHRKRVNPLEIIALAAILLAPVAWFVFRAKQKTVAAKGQVKRKRR